MFVRAGLLRPARQRRPVPPRGPYQVNEHHVFGPNTVIAGTAAGPFKSADGDVLVLGFHGQIMYDENGNLTLEKWTGACP